MLQDEFVYESTSCQAGVDLFPLDAPDEGHTSGVPDTRSGHSRVDYCNSLFVCPTVHSLGRLQMILNAIAHLLGEIKKSNDNTTALLDRLHWLPIPHIVGYKLCLMTVNAPYGLAIPYASGLCQSVSTIESRVLKLRSAAIDGQLVVPRIRTEFV